MSTEFNPSRRNFIRNSAKAGMALTAIATIPETLQACAGPKVVAGSRAFVTGFDQTPLPYAYNALEPVIDATTMELHYSKHAASYSKALKEAVAAENASSAKSVEDLLGNISKYSPKMRNNGGGHYNHELFWQLMKSGGEGKPSGALLSAIERDFSSFDSFKTQFSEAAKTRFGSGWAWLVVTNDKKLRIGSSPNQDNPLMDVSELKGFPLLGLDVWEHAYYLKYQNRRPEYVENWWKVINWSFVQDRFAKA